MDEVTLDDIRHDMKGVFPTIMNGMIVFGISCALAQLVDPVKVDPVKVDYL